MLKNLLIYQWRDASGEIVISSDKPMRALVHPAEVVLLVQAKDMSTTQVLLKNGHVVSSAQNEADMLKALGLDPDTIAQAAASFEKQLRRTR